MNKLRSIGAGKEFYRQSASGEIVEDRLRGKRQSPDIDCVEDQKMRQIIGNLIQVDPKERWTAKDALDYDGRYSDTGFSRRHIRSHEVRLQSVTGLIGSYVFVFVEVCCSADQRPCF